MPRRACWWMDLGVDPDISPNALSPSVTHPVENSTAFVTDSTDQMHTNSSAAKLHLPPL